MLFLTDNKIASVDELNNIDCLNSLHEVSFAGNPVTLRQHRAILVATQPNIQLIDGIPVSIDERAEAEAMLDAVYDISEPKGSFGDAGGKAEKNRDTNLYNPGHRVSMHFNSNLAWEDSDRLRLQNLLNLNRDDGEKRGVFQSEIARASLAGRRKFPKY